MNISDLLKEKKRVSEIITGKFGFPKHKTLWYISLNPSLINDDFLEWLSVLPVNFLIISDKQDLSKHDNIIFTNNDIKETVWFDFVLCDECEGNMSKYFSLWVTPVVSKANVVSSLLSEFNPGKVTGNAYIFENNNKWEIFYALVRYLENYKFPYDNKALVKNVLEI